MAYRDFHQPDRSPSEQSSEAVGAARSLSTRLVGGSMAMRRAHGEPPQLKGKWLFDPIFSDSDFESLRQWCSDDDPRPLVVEVGFQRARFARAFCEANPDIRYMGFEVRTKFCQDANEWLERGGIENARLALVDARECLPLLIEPGTLDCLYAFFPDPWWKKRHMKKRLVSNAFAFEVSNLLKDQGILLIKTDVQGYADWAETELRAEPNYDVNRLADASAGLPLTQRERKCALHGRPTWAIEAIRNTRVSNGVTASHDH